MESSGKAHRLIGRLLLLVILGSTGWAAYTHYTSKNVQVLTAKEDAPFYTAILTQPAMVAGYNPHTRKATLTTLKRRKLPKDPLENAQDLFALAGLSDIPVRYYIPRHIKRDEYWQQFRNDLTTWRNKPFLVGRIAWDYLQALHDKRTNIRLSEFLLLAMEGTRLELTDFTVQNPENSKKKNKPTRSTVGPDVILPPVEDRAPLAMADRPLVLEVLNGSGKKGAAMELTQYLRELNQKGLLSVDVLQYENFPGEKQATTRIIDYTGRRNQLKQLSTAIGINNEIVSEKQDSSICDARIIIGEDFKQPL